MGGGVGGGWGGGGGGVREFGRCFGIGLKMLRLAAASGLSGEVSMRYSTLNPKP